MSGQRQSASRQIFVPMEKEKAFTLCAEAGKMVGEVRDEFPMLGMMTLKTGIRLWPPRNPVSLSIAVIPVENGCNVQCEADSWDGAVGFGSAPKVIAEFCSALESKIEKV